MLDAAIAFFWPDGMMEHTMVGPGVERAGPALHQIYRLTVTADGHLIYFAVSDAEFHGLFRALGHPEWCEDARFKHVSGRMAHGTALEPLLREAFRGWKTAEILARMAAEELPVAPVLSLDEVLADPQVKHNEILLEREHPTAGTIRQPRPPARFDRTPAEAGRLRTAARRAQRRDPGGARRRRRRAREPARLRRRQLAGVDPEAFNEADVYGRPIPPGAGGGSGSAPAAAVPGSARRPAHAIGRGSVGATSAGAIVSPARADRRRGGGTTRTERAERRVPLSVAVDHDLVAGLEIADANPARDPNEISGIVEIDDAILDAGPRHRDAVPDVVDLGDRQRLGLRRTSRENAAADAKRRERCMTAPFVAGNERRCIARATGHALAETR